MNRKNLGEKSWYRALKVFFVISFILGLLLGVALASQIANEKVSMVVCDNGKEFKSDFFYLADSKKVENYKECDPASYFLHRSEVSGRLTDDQREQFKQTILGMVDSGRHEWEMQEAADSFKVANADTTPSPDKGKSYTTEELTKMYGHDFSDTFRGPNGNLWVSNFVLEERSKYSLIQQVGVYLVTILVVVFVFWLFSRIFFYIFARENFITLPKIESSK